MKKGRQRGFSLIELMVVIAILTLVMGVVFTTIANVQRRSQTESQRVDVSQNSREYMDQLSRDLRNSGYPNARMFDAAALGTPAANSQFLAAGMIAVSATDIWFEGDIDGSGGISNVRYTLQADASGNCPCTMRRSAVSRAVVSAPTSVVPSYSAEMAGVVNSIGGSSAWTIAGTAPNGTTNDTMYAGYKGQPIFQYFDKDNNPITVPSDLSSTNLASGKAAAGSVAYIVVTVNALSPLVDQQTGLRAATSMQSAIRLSNL